MSDERKPYVPPGVETVEVPKLIEAVGPVQALLSAPVLRKATFRA